MKLERLKDEFSVCRPDHIFMKNENRRKAEAGFGRLGLPAPKKQEV